MMEIRRTQTGSVEMRSGRTIHWWVTYHDRYRKTLHWCAWYVDEGKRYKGQQLVEKRYWRTEEEAVAAVHRKFKARRRRRR